MTRVSVLLAGVAGLAMIGGAAHAEALPVAYYTVTGSTQGIPTIEVRNVAESNNLQQLDLAYEDGMVGTAVVGLVRCNPWYEETWAKKEGYAFQSTALRLGTQGEPKIVEQVSGIGFLQDMVNNAVSRPLQELIDEGSIVDPAAAVLAKAEQSGAKLDYLRQDQSFEVDVPVSLIATCVRYFRDKIGKQTVIEHGQPSYEKEITAKVRIVYEGDPDLYDVQLNANIAQGMQGGVQAQEPPAEPVPPLYVPGHLSSLTAMKQNFAETCPGVMPFQIRFKGEGQGQIRYRIMDVTNWQPIFLSEAVDFDGAEGDLVAQYAYQVNWEGPQSLEEREHKWILQAQFKDKDSSYFTPAQWGNMDTAVWTQRCLPQLNVNVEGGQTVAKPGQQQSPQMPSLGLKAVTDLPKPGFKAATPAQAAPAQVAPDIAPSQPAQINRQPAREPAGAAPARASDPANRMGRGAGDDAPAERRSER